MNHFDKVAGAGRPAVQVAVLGLRRFTGAAGGALGGLDARCQRGEDRLQVGYRILGTTDHEAVAALETPDAAARAAVHQPDPPLGQLPGPADVVAVIGVAAVDDHVTGL